ncbi:MAG: hypothetical protein J6C44_09315 [Muribaculaceae bacterium]|nr:hypothetical protein [Muribaculaceae bacterium]
MKALHIFTLATLLLSLSARANSDNNDNTNDNIYEPFNIKYEYTLIEKNGHKDCIGTLSFSLNITDETNYIILQRTIPHYKKDDIHFKYKRRIDCTSTDNIVNVSIDNVYWGTYFNVIFFFKNKETTKSSTHHTDTYISQADLDILNDGMGVDDIKDDGSLITYNPENKTLSVSHPVNCEIYDLLGRVLFTGAIEDCISLSGFNAGLIIVHCLDNNRKIVKKIKL